ncbi:MAG: alpha-galactosidase [Chloroflexota bacterium]|jgi:alpha-galactosidase
MERYVLIGAGSASFTRGLLADLVASGQQCEVRLVDPNPEALRVAERLAHKMIAQTHAPIVLRASTNRRDVLLGATVVICTVGVGGRRAWEQDVFIPRQYGVYMPVGDTVGPGGSSRSIRMIPAMIAIARDVADLCPDALFFNYSNPMAPICQAITHAVGIPVIGLCHGVLHVLHFLAETLHVPAATLRAHYAGYNHLTWMTSIDSAGTDLMPLMHAYAKAQQTIPVTHADQNRFSWELFQLTGAFPAVLDRHVTEFFPQFFRNGQYYGMRLGVDAFSFEGTIADGDAEFSAMAADALATTPLPDTLFVREAGEHEQVVEIVQTIRRHTPEVYAINSPNRGQVPDLPLGAIVESPAQMQNGMLTPLVQAPLGPAAAGMLASRYAWVNLIVEAALTQNRDAFLQALIIDGSVASLQDVYAMGTALWTHTTSYIDTTTNGRGK